jgi:hypothetical protein
MLRQKSEPNRKSRLIRIIAICKRGSLQRSPYIRFFSFFGLRENPFAVSPDPRYLFVTPGMQEAWEALEYGSSRTKESSSSPAKPGPARLH